MSDLTVETSPSAPSRIFKNQYLFLLKKKTFTKKNQKKEVNKYKNNGNLSSFDISTFVFLPSIQQVN